MEEILQDPKTSWEEKIRLALKSEGHAMNGGVTLALINATEALSKEAGHEGHSIPLVMKTTTKPEDNDHNEGCLHRSQSADEVLSNNDSPMSYGYKQPCTRKPAKNNPRRGFTFLAGRGKSSDSINRATSTSSHSSKNTSHSVNSSLASVDMMDFWVDHGAVAYSMETLNEIESRRETQQCTITNDDDESSCPTNGFLDWNRDDESSAYPSQHASPEGSSPDKQDIHTDDHEGAAGSERPQAPKVRQRESWNIEDYDFEPVRQHPGPFIPSMLRTLSSSLLSKLSLELGSGTFPQDDRCGPQEATTDEVKKSLHLSFSRANKYRLDSDSNSRLASY